MISRLFLYVTCITRQQCRIAFDIGGHDKQSFAALGEAFLIVVLHG
jgi:hypothetical protein